MRDDEDGDEHSTTRLTSSAPWAVTDVRLLPGYRLSVRFRDGTCGDVDVSRLIFRRNAGVFERLRDPAVFERVYIDGGAVTWPGEVDLAPDAMYDAIRARGTWTPE